MQWTAEGSVFGAVSLWVFWFVYEISLEPLNGFAPDSHRRRLGPRADEFEGQGQRSRSPGTNNCIIWPFQWPGCGLCLVKHL